MSEIERYIRQAAAKRGIDPEIAVRVARSEGGLNDPVRQSLVKKNGRQEPSYGPYQLLIGGGNSGFPTGMGNDALRAGIDPRDPNQWQRGVDFALDGANANGWGAWYGAKAAGIGNRQGIGGKPQPVGANLMAPPITTSRDVTDRPIVNNTDGMRHEAMAAQAAIPTDPNAAPVDSTLFGRMKERFAAADAKEGGALGPLSKFVENQSKQREALAQEHAAPIQSNLGAFEAADSSRMAQAQAMMSQLMNARKAKVPGFSMMG